MKIDCVIVCSESGWSLRICSQAERASFLAAFGQRSSCLRRWTNITWLASAQFCLALARAQLFVSMHRFLAFCFPAILPYNFLLCYRKCRGTATSDSQREWYCQSGTYTCLFHPCGLGGEPMLTMWTLHCGPGHRWTDVSFDRGCR